MVIPGLEVALESDLLRRKRLALLVNQTAVDRRLRHAIDLMAARSDLHVAGILGPEHGARGTAQDQIGVGEERDPATGIPIHSLYGASEASLKPSPEILRNVDAIVYDIQDIGARYYTFVYSLAFCMEAAAEQGKEVIVLDRPNPIGGAACEGNVLNPRFRSFVGRYPLAVRHGMTAGELAQLFNDAVGIGCRLTVVRMRGWKRAMWFEETGLPWIAPSPNMPTIATAAVYPGMCLVEGTNLSEGRGTTQPFELVGAPWLDGRVFARELNRENLPGVIFRQASFEPVFHKHARRICGGVQLHVVDQARFRPFTTGLAVVAAARRLAPAAFDWRREPYEFVSDRLAFDLLAGTDRLRLAIEAGEPIADLEAAWQPELESFRQLRSKYLLYD